MSFISGSIGDPTPPRQTQTNNNCSKIFGQVSTSVMAVATAITSFVATNSLFPGLAATLTGLFNALPPIAVATVALGTLSASALFILGLIEITKSRAGSVPVRTP